MEAANSVPGWIVATLARNYRSRPGTSPLPHGIAVLGLERRHSHTELPFSAWIVAVPTRNGRSRPGSSPLPHGMAALGLGRRTLSSGFCERHRRPPSAGISPARIGPAPHGSPPLPGSAPVESAQCWLLAPLEGLRHGGVTIDQAQYVVFFFIEGLGFRV